MINGIPCQILNDQSAMQAGAEKTAAFQLKSFNYMPICAPKFSDLYD